MYLRHMRVKKKDKVHTYWALVKSVRNGKSVRQEMVARLGELDEHGRVQARDLARRITGREHPGQLNLFESQPDEAVQFKLTGVRLERSRQFGDVWLGWVLWNALKFDELFSRLISAGQEDAPWSRVIATLVLARLCDPSSELHIAEQWFRKTALDDLLNIPEEKINDDRLYRGLDVLLPFKDDIELHVKNRLGEMFEVTYDILLYDMTSTYFEGQANGNPLAQRGHSRDQRSDCKQVNIALVATKEGLPLSSEIFAGNTADVKTVKSIIGKIEAKFGKSNRVWIMDRGMVSADVLSWLQQEKRSYIVGTPKSDLKKFEAQLLEQRDWVEIRDGLEVKQCPTSEGQDTFILCRSNARKEKEQAMRERVAKSIEDGLNRMKGRLDHAKKKQNRDKLILQLGRLLGRNSRVARFYDIQLLEDANHTSGVALSWTRKKIEEDSATLADGCYLLRASQLDWQPEELWKAYMQLTDVEDAFRIHKSELELRPIWHHSSDRVQAHILVCFIAYVLWKTLEQWSQKAGLGKSPRKLLEEFAAIQSADVILPTTKSIDLKLRCVTTPEKPLTLLLGSPWTPTPETPQPSTWSER
jgi:transposase